METQQSPLPEQGKKRGFVRRIYDWVLSWERSAHSQWALFVLAFAESSFFPIPPDILLIAMSLSASKKAFKYALICSVGSVTGGIVGYYIGYAMYEAIALPILEMYNYTAKFQELLDQFKDYTFISVLIAAVTPIPYKLFTIASGVAHADLAIFVTASVIGRSARFFAVAGLIYAFGPKISRFIDKYFELLTLAFMILVVAGFIAVKLLF